MMKRIQIFESEYPSKLEEVVNSFLETNYSSNPKVVGYQTVVLGMSTSHSCLIEYDVN
ncbi:hypothetical protein ACVRZC_06045 [Streptococcus hyointestinalis]